MQTIKKPKAIWARFWMRVASVRHLTTLGMRLAAWGVPPHKGRTFLSNISQVGFIESDAIIHHSGLKMGKHCFVGSGVIIYERKNGGAVKFGDRVEINRGSILETGMGGQISIGDHSSIHPFCHLYAYLAPVRIGSGVMVAPNCAVYSYDHGLLTNQPVRIQPLSTKGEVVIEDEAWLGFGAIVLSGVKIGKGAVIGAGSLVNTNIPENAIAAGNPARVVKMRKNHGS